MSTRTILYTTADPDAPEHLQALAMTFDFPSCALRGIEYGRSVQEAAQKMRKSLDEEQSRSSPLNEKSFKIAAHRADRLAQARMLRMAVARPYQGSDI